MSDLTFKNKESKVQILRDFICSEQEKVYQIIGQSQIQLYSFLDKVQSFFSKDKKNIVFIYEIWPMEHSKHFLYRWLSETVSGFAFQGNGSWSEIIDNQPHLKKRLQLLLDQDTRPLEIRFIEAIRFFTQRLNSSQRLVLFFVPRTEMQDKVFVDFFKVIISQLPFKVKTIIAQKSHDVLAQEEDFYSSNRLALDNVDKDAEEQIRKKYSNYTQAEEDNCLLRILSYLASPVSVDLLEKTCNKSKDWIMQSLEDIDLFEKVVKNSQTQFRIHYPELLNGEEIKNLQIKELNEQVAEYFRQKLFQSEKEQYLALINHSLSLFRHPQGEFVASEALATYKLKMALGGTEICEVEFERALELIEKDQEQLRGNLLRALGEVFEIRQMYQEALKKLDSAIQFLENSGDKRDLISAFELKARALFSSGEMEKAKAELEKALNWAKETSNELLVADITSQLAYVFYSLNNISKAEQLYTESLKLYQSLPQNTHSSSIRGEAEQYFNLAHTSYAKGDLENTLEYHQKALDIFKSLGDKKSVANGLGYLGHTYFAQQDYKRAIETFENAVQIQKELGEAKKVAQYSASIGYTLYIQNKLEQAQKYFQRALDYYQEISDPKGEADQLANLGLINGDQGEFRKARKSIEQAAKLYQNLGDFLSEATQIERLGHIFRAQKEFKAAEENYKEALEKFQNFRYPMGEASAKLDLGQLYFEMSEWSKAANCFQEASQVYSELQNVEKEAMSLILLGYTQRTMGDPSTVASLEKAKDLYLKVDDKLGAARVLAQIGLIQSEQRKYEQSEGSYHQALDIFQEMQDKENEASIQSNLGTLYYETNRLDNSQEAYNRALFLFHELKQDENISGVLFNLSFVHEEKGEYDKACSVLSEAKLIYARCKMTDKEELVDKRLKMLENKKNQTANEMQGKINSQVNKDKPQSGKSGRNDPCPCGSGKKFKKCCGK